MAKALPLPYKHEPVPLNVDDIPRYLEVELARLEEALYSEVTAAYITEQSLVDIGTAFTWVQVAEVAPEWENPGGMHDPVTGATTLTQDGLYDINFHLEIAPFGSGNKDYYAGVRIHYDGHRGEIDWESNDGGADNMPLGVTLSGLQIMYAGDVLTWFIGAEHEQFTGTTDAGYGIQFINQAKK